MPEWLTDVLNGTIVLALGGIIWRLHASHDDERNVNLWNALGRDSQQGVRKLAHDAHANTQGQASEIRDLRARVERLEAKLMRLDER